MVLALYFTVYSFRTGLLNAKLTLWSNLLTTPRWVARKLGDETGGGSVLLSPQSAICIFHWNYFLLGEYKNWTTWTLFLERYAHVEMIKYIFSVIWEPGVKFHSLIVLGRQKKFRIPQQIGNIKPESVCTVRDREGEHDSQLYLHPHRLRANHISHCLNYSFSSSQPSTSRCPPRICFSVCRRRQQLCFPFGGTVGSMILRIKQTKTVLIAVTVKMKQLMICILFWFRWFMRSIWAW